MCSFSEARCITAKNGFERRFLFGEKEVNFRADKPFYDHAVELQEFASCTGSGRRDHARWAWSSK